MRFLPMATDPDREEHGPKALRMVAIIPLVLSAFAFLLTILAMAAGHNTTTLPGLAIFTLNTSRLGDNILQELEAEVRSIHLTSPKLPTALIQPNAAPDLKPRSAEDDENLHPLDRRGLVSTLLGNVGQVVDTAADSAADAAGNIASAAANATASAAGAAGNALGGILDSAKSGLSAVTRKIFGALFSQIRGALGTILKPLERAIARAIVRFAASKIDDLKGELGNLTAAATAQIGPALRNATHAAERALIREIGQRVQSTERRIASALANETKQVAGAVADKARARLDAAKSNLVDYARNETADIGRAVASRLATNLDHAKDTLLSAAANKTGDVAAAAGRKASEALQHAGADALDFAHNKTRQVESAVISKSTASLAAAKEDILADLSDAAGNAGHVLGAAARNATSKAAKVASRDVISVLHIARSILRNKTLALESSVETKALNALGGLQANFVPTVNRALKGVTNDIELADFYSFYTLGSCSGMYVGNGTNPEQNVLSCSKYKDINPLSNLKQAISFGMVSSGMALFTAIWAVVKVPSLVSARMNAFSAGAAVVMISTLAAIFGSVSGSTAKLVNIYGAPVGVSAVAPTGYRVLLWTAAVLMGLSTIVWYVIYIWFERRTKQMLKSLMNARTEAVHISAPVDTSEKGWSRDQHWGER